MRPSIGIMDVAMALEARGDMKYGDKGNMTKAEIDKTIDIMIGLKKSGHFRAFWTNFDQSVNLMASGEVVIQSMWSPAVTAVRSARHRLLLRAAQGRLSRLGERPGADGASDRAEARLRDGIPELVQFRLAGRLHRQAGLLQPVPETAKKFMTARRVGLLVRGQAGRGRHQGPVRPSDGEGRRDPRRRLASGTGWAISPAGTP